MQSSKKTIWKKLTNWFVHWVAKDTIEKQQQEYNGLKFLYDNLDRQFGEVITERENLKYAIKYYEHTNEKLSEELTKHTQVLNLFGTLEECQVTHIELRQFKKLCIMANTSLSELEKENQIITRDYEELKKNNELTPMHEARMEHNNEVMEKFRFMTQCMNNIVKKLDGII